MRIRMLTIYASPAGILHADREYTVAAALGQQLIKSRAAVAVQAKQESAAETTEAEPAAMTATGMETTAARKQRFRKPP